MRVAHRQLAISLCLLALAAAGCASSARYTRDGENRAQPRPGTAREPVRKSGKSFTGEASYYGPGFHGKQTANGERFDQNAMTAAHKKLPFGTRLRVTNLDNGKSVVVRINDRGPYAKGRVLDLALGAAKKLGMMQSGTARIRAEILK